MGAQRLPTSLTELIGREQELDLARQVVLGARARLVTLTGPGGVGKTRLALELAADLADEFVDGVYFVSLAPITDPALVMASIAQTLELRQAGETTPLERLKNHLLFSRALLVLDNFEQVQAAGPELAELLTACPEVALLVTSRGPLHISGERELPVPPLALPSLDRLPEPAGLARCPAVALFVQRATAIKPAFRLDAGNAATVAAICARLEGLPLSLELAAARIKLLPPAALLARLDRRLPLLVDGAQDLPERQRSLRDTLAWSYALLDAGEQRLFRRLAVCAGGSLEAAEAVGNLPGEPHMDVLARATSLVDKSLLMTAQGAGAEPRLAMLETVREYALEQLEAASEGEAARGAHTRFYFALAETAEPELITAEQGQWLDRLELENDNLRAALRWSLDHGQAGAALRASGSLWQFWFVRGYLSEGRRWLAETLEQTAGSEPVARAKALSGAATLATFQADYSAAVRLGTEALELFRQLGIRPGVAATLGGLAFAHAFQGHYAAARALSDEGVAIWRELGDPWGLATSLNFVGFGLVMGGDYAAARVYAQEALALFRRVGDARGSAFTLFALGFVSLSEGDYPAAEPLLEQSLALLRPLDDKRSVVMSLVGLTEIALDRRDTQTARSLLTEASAVLSEVGDKWFMAMSLEDAAALALAEHRPELAARLLGAADGLHESMGAPVPTCRRKFYDRTLAALRVQLAQAALGQAWAEGRAMTPDQLLAASAAAPADSSRLPPNTSRPASLKCCACWPPA